MNLIDRDGRGAAWLVCATLVVFLGCAPSAQEPVFDQYGADGSVDESPNDSLKDGSDQGMNKGKPPADCDDGWGGDECDVPLKTCGTIQAVVAGAASGVYWVDPDGAEASPPVQVYCDMDTDGGGWTKILQYKDAPYTPTAQAVGNIAQAGVGGFAKLDDAVVNAMIASGGGIATYRLSGGLSDYKLFVDVPSAEFSDLEAAWGISEHASGMGVLSTYSTCHAKSFSECDALWVAGRASMLDSLDWVRENDYENINATDPKTGVHIYNNCDRYYVDWYNYNEHAQTPSPWFNCASTSDFQGVKRCVTAGYTSDGCPADPATGLNIIPDFELWFRPG